MGCLFAIAVCPLYMFISCVFVYLSIYVICEYIAEAPVILASGPQAVTVRAGIEQHDNKCENILILSILKQSTEDLEKNIYQESIECLFVWLLILCVLLFCVYWLHSTNRLDDYLLFQDCPKRSLEILNNLSCVPSVFMERYRDFLDAHINLSPVIGPLIYKVIMVICQVYICSQWNDVWAIWKEPPPFKIDENIVSKSDKRTQLSAFGWGAG